MKGGLAQKCIFACLRDFDNSVHILIAPIGFLKVTKKIPKVNFLQQAPITWPLGSIGPKKSINAKFF